MNLKHDYKNAIPPQSGRAWRITENSDGTVQLADETQYLQNGDAFGAAQLNEIAQSINTLSLFVPQYTDVHGETKWLFKLPEGCTSENCRVIAAFKETGGFGFFQYPFYSATATDKTTIWVCQTADGDITTGTGWFDSVLVQRFK